MNIVKKIMIISSLYASSIIHAGSFTDSLLGPSNNDPRVLAVTGLGFVTAATGIYFCQKGLRGFAVGPGRAGNLLSSCVSFCFVAGGVKTIVSSKDFVKWLTK